jgi:hypothetical protein
MVCTELSCHMYFGKFGCSYTWSDAVPLTERSLGKHRSKMREALIKLFEEPIPESYKADREVMQGVLGRELTDKPVLCFSSNLVLAALIKPDTSPCVWETKDKLKVGYASVVRTDDSAGLELLMDFIGMMVHTKYILCFIGTYSVHTCTKQIHTSLVRN